MRIRFLKGPWPFAIVGSLLILSSTFILGVTLFKKEQALLKVQKKIEIIEFKMHKAQMYYDTANLQVRLAVLQNTISKYIPSKDSDQLKKSTKAYVHSLIAEFFKFYIASGEPAIEEGQLENIESLGEKAIDGDKSALEKIHSLIIDLVRKSGKYWGQLELEKDNLQKTEKELKNKIIYWRNFCLFIQILGLVFLLTKEFPDYLWGSKKNICK